jgi:DNA-binding GntR family transcriptional regulator
MSEANSTAVIETVDLDPFQGAGASLSEQAYGIVERMIVTLELEPGSTFSENELSRRIGIGRTPLREALQQLASDRLVAVLPRRGMMVTGINIAEYVALLATRRVLDKLIVERAARRAAASEREHFLVLAQSIRDPALSSDLKGFLDLDRECDIALNKAAQNPFAAEAVSPLHAHCRRFWSMYRHSADIGTSAQLHGKMMEAVASGNVAEAGNASDRLIDYLVQFTREAVELG